MINVLFVCHGNICRSPMAEFIMKDIIKKNHLEDKFYIASAATSREEIGNPVHYGTKKILDGLGISAKGKTAVQMTKEDYKNYDYLIGMDDFNIQNMLRITGGDNAHKIFKLPEFADSSKDIADPWYTGDFETTYRDIQKGCDGLFAYLQKIQAV